MLLDSGHKSIGNLDLCSEIVLDTVLLGHASSDLLAWLLLVVLLRHKDDSIEVDVELFQFLTVSFGLWEANKNESLDFRKTAIFIFKRNQLLD